MRHPLISIVIATLNSEKTLPFVLESIKKQSYPAGKIEILIVDGGSKDETLDIARDFHCKVVSNPKVDLVFAKHIGYKAARGRFLMFLDSDEVVKNVDSIKLKVETMLTDPRIKAVISSGYIKPKAYPSINYYINEFGDPFSLFMYFSPRDYKYFLKVILTKFKPVYEDDKKAVFDFSKSPNPPFIELISMGVMIDLSYVRKTFPKVLTNISAHTHLFYLLVSKEVLIAIRRGDPIIHYSVATIKNYLKKIASRVKGNIFTTHMGQAGFVGREKYFGSKYRVKKFLFIFYSLSLFFPILDSVYLWATRRRSVYLIHPFICLYTVYLIIYYLVIKFLGTKIRLYGYGT